MHILPNLVTYIHTYSIVEDVRNKVHVKTSRLFIVFNTLLIILHITDYVTCVSGCFGGVKAEGASRSTPSFIIFLPFYRLNEEKEDSEG